MSAGLSSFVSGRSRDATLFHAVLALCALTMGVVDPQLLSPRVFPSVLPTLMAAEQLPPAPTSATSAETPAPDRELWQVLAVQGARVGHSHLASWRLEDNGEIQHRSRTEIRIVLTRFGQTLVSESVVDCLERDNGEMISFESTQGSGGGESSRTVGTVEGERLKLATTTAGVTRTVERPFESAWRSPHFHDRVLREQPLKPGDRRSFTMFVPQFGKAEECTLTALDWEETPLWQGDTAKLLHIVFKQGAITIDLWVDEQGEPRKDGVTILGERFESFTVPQAEALREVDAGDIDFAVRTLVPTTHVVNLNNAARRAEVSLTGPKGEDLNGLVIEARGVTQREGTATLPAVVVLVPAQVPEKLTAAQLKRGKATAPGADSEYLVSSSLVQSDDDAVREFARNAVGTATDPAAQARLLEAAVRRHIRSVNFSSAMASASEVVRSRSGDCTEHAVLLAAALRAVGIPSRVVVGYVHASASHAFAMHMWTEAQLGGEWYPLDATQAAGGIGCGHLPLARSSLTDAGESTSALLTPVLGQLNNLKIEVLSVEPLAP